MTQSDDYVSSTMTCIGICLCPTVTAHA